MVVDPLGQAGQVLMSGALVSGIPHAFVVDSEGVVQYHGHPASPEFERAVQKVRFAKTVQTCIEMHASAASAPTGSCVGMLE